MARIYTRTGDGGETSLFDGTRTSKADPRVDLYGDVDELNSLLGCAIANLERVAEADGRLILDDLLRIQNDLFELGAVLADPVRSAELAADPQAATAFEAQLLEQWIDRHQDELPRLTSFILPGGSEPAALLHVARTVCRRVERRAVRLAGSQPVPTAVIVYLNRLSDYLFVAARRTNLLVGDTDVIWRVRGTDDGEPAS